MLCHRAIASGGGLVARERREITRLRDCVTPPAGLQTRLIAQDAQTARLRALVRAALAHVTTELVRKRADTPRQIAIASGLIALGSQLIAVGARLIAV
ncbi:MAG: hypothetical protein LC790_09500, partial [Actinobacteria bacterium]|nr:hypothetical protein [Actinomycetota bacterium]